MTGRKNLVAVDSDAPVSETTPQSGAVSVEEPSSEPAAMEQDWDETGAPNAPRLAIGAALAAIAAWTAFFIWSHWVEMAAGAPAALWAQWIGDWSLPVLLVAAIWLIAMRHSTREAARFGDAARALALESQTLEGRLTLVNRELSLAREFIAAQSRDLESLGRVAAERLSQNADRLQSLIRDNGEQVETIGRVSQTAMDNMGRLRDSLPVIANSARDVASQIGRAGDAAEDRVSALIAGFERLNEFGEASGRAVDSVRGRVDEAVSAFEMQAQALQDITGSRFAELTQRSESFRADLETREVETLAAIRRRASTLEDELSARHAEFSEAQQAALTALQARMEMLREEGHVIVDTLHHGQVELGESLQEVIQSLEQRMIAAIERVNAADEGAMDHARARLASIMEEAARVDQLLQERQDGIDAQVEQRRKAVAARESEDMAGLEQRMAAFDQGVSSRQAEHLASVERLAARGEELSARLTLIAGDLSRLSEQGEGTGDAIARKAGEFEQRLASSRALLEDSEARIAALTESSIRLLDLIRSGTEHSGTHLPEALDLAEREMAAVEERAQTLSTIIAEANSKGAALAGHVHAITRDGSSTLELLGDLDRRLTDLSGRSETIAGDARMRLDEAMAALQAASVEVLSRLRDDHAQSVRDIAGSIARESGDAIEQTLRNHAALAIAELQQAAEQAGEMGRTTASQLRSELEEVNQLADMLARRVSETRANAEDRVDDDFARRVALLTESLNSATIDITKAFDNEVTDIAWANYLRGDRGIFTRRAVRLLDNQDQRAISDIYDGDGEFRETVNRYVHDFEAMLRNILSTRDGNAMAVTLLSSDMGKLYVALAQAINRLRN